MSDAAFQSLMGRINSLIQQVESKVGEFLRAAGKAAGHLPWLLGDWAKGLVNKVRDAWNALMKKVHEYIQHGGQPGNLSAAAKQLSDEVQAKVSAEAPIYRTDNQHSNTLLADDKWQGDAADAYRQVLMPQSTALSGYADTCSAVSTALNECAWAITVFWGGVAGALIVLVAGLIAAIALSETVVGGVAAALAALATAGATVGTCLLIAQNTMSSQASVFRTQANDNKAFGQTWPRAGRSLLDGTPRA